MNTCLDVIIWANFRKLLYNFTSNSTSNTCYQNCFIQIQFIVLEVFINGVRRCHRFNADSRPLAEKNGCREKWISSLYFCHTPDLIRELGKARPRIYTIILTMTGVSESSTKLNGRSTIL